MFDKFIQDLFNRLLDKAAPNGFYSSKRTQLTKISKGRLQNVLSIAVMHVVLLRFTVLHDVNKAKNLALYNLGQIKKQLESLKWYQWSRKRQLIESFEYNRGIRDAVESLLQEVEAIGPDKLKKMEVLFNQIKPATKNENQEVNA